MTCLLCRLKTTDARAPICKNGPCKICTTLTQVDEDINQAVVTLRHLLSKRCDILSEHNRVHGLIHRLPIELKNRIFELLLPLQDEWGEIIGTGMHSFLSTISVCKGWRDIALSNPFLWSKIHIDLRKPMSSSQIGDWILRSQALPLNLHIHVDNGTIEPEPVLDAINRCSNRLQSLALDAPSSFLGRLQHDNFQYHHLTQLRIISPQSPQFDQPLSLLNSTASPEKIELGGVSFRSLQISWNRLVTARVKDFDLEDLTQLFQHASQMTFCQIFALRRSPDNFSMPPIIHHSLKALTLYLSPGWGVAPAPLGSLTLPSLQEVEISESTLLTQLPALVRRSSCPLTRLTLYQYRFNFPFDDLQPLPGVADLIVEIWNSEGSAMMKLLLEGYFPDLRNLALYLQPFEVLWGIGLIPLLVECKRPRPDEPNEGRLDKFIVVDQRREADRNLDVGEKLKEMNITMREDGFEFF